MAILSSLIVGVESTIKMRIPRILGKDPEKPGIVNIGDRMLEALIKGAIQSPSDQGRP